MNQLDEHPDHQRAPFYLKYRALIVLSVLILLAITARVLVALQYWSNFDSDEAIHGLMARHVLQGHFATYFYGQNYLGSLEAIIAAGFIKLFGSTVMVLRLSSIFLVVGGFLLFWMLIRRLWNDRVALWSLLGLALPGAAIIGNNFRPIVNTGVVILLGSWALLMTQSSTIRNNWRTYYLFILGIIFALGLWSHFLFGYYIIIIALLFWLESPEWQNLYDRLIKFFQARFPVPPEVIMLLAMLLGGSLLFLAFFTKGFEPQQIFSGVRRLAMLALLVTGGALAILWYAVSRRRKILAFSALVLASGFVLGCFPMWIAWLGNGVLPRPFYRASSPALIFEQFQRVVMELFPNMWGLPGLRDVTIYSPPTLSLWHRSPLEVVFNVSILLVLTVAFTSYFWSQRKLFFRFLTLVPARTDDRKHLLIGMMFIGPVLVSIFSGNTTDVWSIRYMIVAWQAGTVILALFFERLARHSRALVWIVAGMTIILVGIKNQMDIYVSSKHHVAYTASSLKGVQTYLEENQVCGGYADFWQAYCLDYLYHEDLAITPFNGVDRYSDYTRQVKSSAKQAIILHQQVHPVADSGRMEDLIQTLDGAYGMGPAFQALLTELHQKSLWDRRKIEHWDVWLVGDQPGTQSKSTPEIRH